MAKEITLNDRNCLLFPPKKGSDNHKNAIILINGNKAMADIMVQNHFLPAENFWSAVILSENWPDDFSPWPAAALNTYSSPFGGKADEYISWLKNDLMPCIKESIFNNADDIRVGILGQSLSALFNFYLNIKEPDFFSFAACISPSTWFNGWIEYFESSIKNLKCKEWYISCGAKEGTRCKDLRKNTLAATNKTIELLRENGHEVTFYQDNGDHFNHIVKRIEDSFNWLSEKIQREL